MTTWAQSLGEIRKPWKWIAARAMRRCIDASLTRVCPLELEHVQQEVSQLLERAS